LVKTFTLREALANSTLSDLRGIATLRGMDNAATATKGELLEPLTESLGSVAALTAAVRALDPDEHLALEALIDEGGAADSAPFQAYFGEVRRGSPPSSAAAPAPEPALRRPQFGGPWIGIGPAQQGNSFPQSGGLPPHSGETALGRPDLGAGPAKPAFWQKPASPLESLWYRGLVFKTGMGYSETLFVPSDTLPILAPLVAATRPSVSLDPLPGNIQSRPEADLLGDLLQMLVLVKTESIKPVHEWKLPKRTLLALNDRLSVFQSNLASLQDESQARYIYLLHRILMELRLMTNSGALLAPTVGTARWFQKGRLDQMRDIWGLPRLRTLLNETDGEELDYFLGQERVAVARGQIVKLIGACPPEEWISLASLSRKVRYDHPQLLRGWSRGLSHVVRGDDGRLLTASASWDRLEGAFIKEVVSKTLSWFGLVQMAESGEAFRLSPLGAILLAGRPATPAAPEPRPIIIQPNFEILAHAEAAQADLYRLEDFADLVKRDIVSTYALTRNSLRRSLEAGHQVQDTLDFLQTASGRDVPQNVAYTLREWAGKYGQIEVRQLSVLTTKGDAQLKELVADPKLKLPVAEHLGPQAVAVDTAEVRRLIGGLRRLGYMPLVDPALDDSARRPSTLVPVRDADLVLLLASARLVCELADAPVIGTALLDKLTEQLGLGSADEIARARTRLEAALDDANRAADTGKSPAVRFNTALSLPIVETAIRKRLTVQLEYYEETKGSIVRQQVDPWRLERRRGQEYLVGFSHTTLSERAYVLAQIRSVTPTRERFDPVSR
jgi:hypothetical protein